MPYKNPQAVSLATEIVKDFLGEGAATVCKHLLTKGQQTLQDVIRGIPDMPSSQVKRNLLVLVQHNLANAYTQPEEIYMKSRRASFHAYEACPDRIIQTVRYARFILHIKKELGEVAEKIIEALLENGRLRFDQLSSAVTARCAHLLSAEADNVDQPESSSSADSPNTNSSITPPPAVNLEERIRNVFVSLVQSYYIERVPPCDLPPPLHKIHTNAIKKKAGSKAGIVAEEVVQSAKTLPELVYSKQRFRLPTDVIMGSSSSSAPASKTTTTTAAAADCKLSNDNDNNNSNNNATEAAAAAAANNKSTTANRKRTTTTTIPAAAAAVVDEAADDVFGARAPPSKRQKMRAGTAKAADMSGILLGGGVGASHGAGSSNGSSSANGASSSSTSGAGYMTEAELQDRLAAEPAFVLWRVNNDEFNRRFRHQKVAKVVGDKLGADAGVVVAAMLNATRASEKQVAEKQSALMTEEEVAGVAMKLGESGVLPKLSFLAASSSAASPTAQVSAILHRIGADGLEAVSYSGTSLGGGSSYAVHMDKSVQAVRQVQLESVVRQKFGISGRRVLRLLFIRGHLEQKQVSDFSMLPAKDTRELLYGMLKEGFVFMQEVPRTSDRAPSRTIFTWYVDFNKSFDVLGSEVLKTMRNVWMRRRFEMERCKDLLDRIEEMQMAAALANSNANNNSNSNSSSNNGASTENKGNGNSAASTAAPPATPMPAFTFTEAQRKKLAMLNSVERVLTSSLLRLDDMSALYNDF